MAKWVCPVCGYVHEGGGDKYIIETLKEIKKPVILIINKIDKMKKEEILLKINEYKDLYEFKEIIPLSALKKNNIDTVTKVLKKYLTDQINMDNCFQKNAGKYNQQKLRLKLSPVSILFYPIDKNCNLLFC